MLSDLKSSIAFYAPSLTVIFIALILFGQSDLVLGQFNSGMPSDSELARSSENIQKVSDDQSRLDSAKNMCDRRIALGEKDIESTCFAFMRVFDYHMRHFLVNNNHTLGMVVYPTTIDIPPLVNFAELGYGHTYLRYLEEFQKMNESCVNADVGIIKLCISLIDDQLTSFQNIESEASQQIAEIMNINTTG